MQQETAVQEPKGVRRHERFCWDRPGEGDRACVCGADEHNRTLRSKARITTPRVGDTVENLVGEIGVVDCWGGEQVLVRYAPNYLNWENPKNLKIKAWAETS